MRWGKHLSMAHADIQMSALLEECGPEGYGIYWLIWEDIASIMESGKMDPRNVHSISKWAEVCHCSTRVWTRVTHSLEKKALIFVQTFDKRVQITIPNILKYKDEYSRKSGHPQDLNRDRYIADTETDTEQKQNGATAPQGLPAPTALKVLAPPPRWKTDPQYRDFIEKASAAWGDLIDADFEDAYHCWRVMDFEHRLACLKAIDTRVEMKTDFHFVARPAKFLKTREYYRPVSQLKTKDDEAIEQARKILKRKMK